MRLLRVLPPVLVVLLATAVPAAAHTSLVSVDPADGSKVDVPPAEIVLTFSENLREPSEASVQVNGDAIDAHVNVDGPRLVIAPADPAPGEHVVNYRVVSADGHPVSGTTTFTVGGAAQAPVVEPTASEPTISTEATESPQPTASDTPSTEPAGEDESDDNGVPVGLWVGLAAVVVLGLGAVAVSRARAGSRDDRA